MCALGVDPALIAIDEFVFTVKLKSKMETTSQSFDGHTSSSNSSVPNAAHEVLILSCVAPVRVELSSEFLSSLELPQLNCLQMIAPGSRIGLGIGPRAGVGVDGEDEKEGKKPGTTRVNRSHSEVQVDIDPLIVSRVLVSAALTSYIGALIETCSSSLPS